MGIVARVLVASTPLVAGWRELVRREGAGAWSEAESNGNLVLSQNNGAHRFMFN